VTHCLTQAGSDLLKELHLPLESLNKQLTRGVKAGDLRQLVDALEQIRGNL
jgi:hypothetical protein